MTSMKKYLMTVAAAVVFGAAFTSCSHDEEVYQPAEPELSNQQKIELAKSEYAAVFERAFGKVGANVDWGFSSKAGTRADVNVNGNQWETVPVVTVEEKNKVFAHVNKDKSQVVGATEQFPENLVNYWVTQVWTGGDSYTSTDGGSSFVGSSKMNNLQIGENASVAINQGNLSSGWYHVNNFNRGDNTDWSGNTLVANSGTFDFAYHNSEDSKYHNKWIAVPGSSIDASLAGYYYVCFDFEATNDGYTVFRFKVPGNNPGEWVEHTANVDGEWTIESAIAAGIQVSYIEYVWNSETSTNEEVTHTYTVGQEGTDAWRIDNVVGGNMSVKGDNVYTDWIIRLVAAQPKAANYRVIAEDLNAAEETDFDFNDVVFDVIPDAANNKTTIKLIAAGGIYPLRVAGQEVHEKFGASKKEDGTYDMINTGAGVTFPVTTFDISGTYDTPEKIKNIKIEVQKIGDQWTELEANTGEAACKILVDDTFGVIAEKHSVASENQNFHLYVQGKFDGKFWWKQDK
mgnify:CR=1 FL=1